MILSAPLGAAATLTGITETHNTKTLYNPNPDRSHILAFFMKLLYQKTALQFSSKIRFAITKLKA